MKVLGPIEGEYITVLNDGSITYRAKAAIDADGIGTPLGDPYFQPDTSLHWMGKALNAEIDKYVVVPPLIVEGVKPIVKGCQAYVVNIRNGMTTEAVVGDIGPPDKLGEISVACARALGIDPSPTTGGVEDHVVHYHIIPGHSAVVDGKVYQLQAA
jgi:hypothetical protein